VFDTWPRVVEVLTRATLQAQRAWLEEGARVVHATVVNLRFSAVQVLEQLEAEQAARQRVEQQRDREHARAERERDQRQAAERQRDEQRHRADEEHRARQQAERTVERVERELARERERTDKANAEPKVSPRKRASRSK
jgi:hypothetical protein